MVIKFKEPEVNHLKILRNRFDAANSVLQQASLAAQDAANLLKSYVSTLSQVYDLGKNNQRFIISNDSSGAELQVDAPPAPADSPASAPKEHAPKKRKSQAGSGVEEKPIPTQ